MESVHEEWRPVVGFEGKYEVSNLGRVKVLARTIAHWCGRRIPKPERIITLTKHTGGYRFVALNGGKKHYVHRLVMEAFVGPDTIGQDVNHINGDKTDNRLANLEYCNRLHNVRHAIANGLQDNRGEGNGQSRYTSDAITAAFNMVRDGATHREASQATGVSVGMISQVVNGTRWKHLNLVSQA